MTTITPHLTPEQVERMRLDRGYHLSPKQGHCLLEVVSMFAGEPFSDRPACVDPVLAAFGRSWNDSMRSNDEREQLKQYIPLLPGTAQGDKLSRRRAFMAADWAIRFCTPTWLDLSKAFAEHAAKLRALPPITDKEQLALARPVLSQARDEALHAWTVAAGVAVRSAAGREAASNAAVDSTSAAAEEAAWDAAKVIAKGHDLSACGWAARDATWSIAALFAWGASCTATTGESEYHAVHAAAVAALAPTVTQLQTSAHDLYLRMIEAQDE